MRYELIRHRPRGCDAYITGINTAEIKIEVGKNEVSKIVIKYFDPHYIWGSLDCVMAKEMHKVGSMEFTDVYRVKISPERNRLSYYFMITDNDGKEYCYTANGIRERELPTAQSNFLMAYLNEEDAVITPEWAKEAVCYQIFPERFNSHENNDLKYVDYHQYTFTGGTIKGVEDKLEYLKDLGITLLYFTPIFQANTVHRYETVDYFNIDKKLGTNEDFKKLVDKAHSMEMRVMLDAVFNHTSSHFFAFEDILKNQEKSKYVDWYYINKFPVTRDYGHEKYETFASVDDMPKLRVTNKETEQYVMDVAKHWITEYNIDGWRFDVANEIPVSFWRRVREQLKELKEDIYLVGESWDDSYIYAMGDTFDGVMSYPFKECLFGLFEKYNIDYGNGSHLWTVKQVQEQYISLLTRYPSPIADANYNLIDSHDVKRIRSYFDDERIIKCITLMQMTLNGMPCIYYGNEVGIHGVGDDGRNVMPWNNIDYDILNYHKEFIKLRHEHKALSRGEIEFINIHDGIMSYKKSYENEEIYVVINREDFKLTDVNSEIFSYEKLYSNTYNTTSFDEFEVRMYINRK